MDTLPESTLFCRQCRGTGIEPCRSAAEIHMLETATFCSCKIGKLGWAATLQQVEGFDKPVKTGRAKCSISIDP